MKIIHNQDLDLNLLYTLEILLEEQSVSKAASRLAVSQSAVSHSLKKLRHCFNDPLLVKTHNGMVPTPSAEKLKGNLHIIIENIHGLFHKGLFDPASARGTIRIAATDYGSSIILPPLMGRLSKLAPNIKIDCVSLSSHMSKELQDGTIDIAFGGYKPFEGAHHEILFYDRYVGVVRANHPVLKDKITKNRLLKWKHILIKVPVGTTRKDKLYKVLGQNITNDFNLKIPYHMIASLSLENSDMILIMPEKGANLITSMTKVSIFELPVKFDSHAYLQSWHARSHNDKMHQWFRNQAKEVCKEPSLKLDR
jgi:DNA-binding transcriptional LysR family regulator